MGRLRAGGALPACHAGCPDCIPIGPLERMSEFAAREPARPADLPVQASEPAVHSPELPVQPPAQPRSQKRSPRNRRRSPRDCGDSSRPSATWWPSRGPRRYWASPTGPSPRICSRREMWVWRPPHPRRHSFSERSVLSGSRSSCWPNSTRYRPRSAASRFSTGMYISCLAVLILSLAHAGPLPVPGRQPEDHRCRLDNRRSLRDRISGDNGRAHLRQRGNRTAPGLGPAVARQPELRAEAGHRGCPRPRRDQNSPRPAVCLGLALVVSLVVCIPMLRLEPTPAGEGNLSHRVALTRRYGVLSLKHHVLNLSINSIYYIVALIAALLILPQATGLLLDRTPGVVHRDDHPVPAGAVPVRRDIRRPEPASTATSAEHSPSDWPCVVGSWSSSRWRLPSSCVSSAPPTS